MQASGCRGFTSSCSSGFGRHKIRFAPHASSYNFSPFLLQGAELGRLAMELRGFWRANVPPAGQESDSDADAPDPRHPAQIPDTPAHRAPAPGSLPAPELRGIHRAAASFFANHHIPTPDSRGIVAAARDWAPEPGECRVFATPAHASPLFCTYLPQPLGLPSTDSYVSPEVLLKLGPMATGRRMLALLLPDCLTEVVNVFYLPLYLVASPSRAGHGLVAVWSRIWSQDFFPCRLRQWRRLVGF